MERRTLQEDPIAKEILARFSDLENNPDETITPYLEFNVEGKLYHFTPGGFLYRREKPGMKDMGGVYCGYLTDEVWRFRTDELPEEEPRPSFWRRLFGG